MVLHPGLKQRPIYLDYNATTPVDPRVVEAMLPYLTHHFGNPSSAHAYASATREGVALAREQVSDLLVCQPDEIVFTGCGSESDLLALRGVALALRGRGNHIITQITEHPAVINTCNALSRLYGCRITYLPVDNYGRVQPADVESAITPQTILVSIMHANNETGTIQPIPEIARIAQRHNILFHTDASQTVGKIPTRVTELGVDLLTVAGHKLYAPKGIGALYVRRGIALEPVLYGGGQEQGRRAGTENVAFMVALGAAAALAQEQLVSSQERTRQLRDLLQDRLEQQLPGRISLNGHPTQRLPNTLNISISGCIGEELLASIPGLASSTGSACHEGSTEPSAVLLAMGLTRERALAALRLTLGRWSNRDEIEQAAAWISQAVQNS
ncbi:MAG TPA: cysteine desulfurase family protein [Ktedonobacteraceae bacterium]